jgi:hypothetical protein
MLSDEDMELFLQTQEIKAVTKGTFTLLVSWGLYKSIISVTKNYHLVNDVRVGLCLLCRREAYVRTYACMCVCMYVCICMYYVCMYVLLCMCVRTYVRMYVYMHT